MPQTLRYMWIWILGFILCAGLLTLFGCLGRLSAPAPSWTACKVLADGQDHPQKILTDGTNVYFVTGGTVASQHEGTNNIIRLSLKDGSQSVLVNGGERIPDQVLALDDQFVYWTDSGNILRVPKAGGQSETIIANVPPPTEMVVDGENIYWIIWSGEKSPPKPLMFAPKRGGAATPLTPGQTGTNGLLIDGDFVYWMTPAGIYKAPKTGGDATVVYPNPAQGPTSGLAQDADNFYFARLGKWGKWPLVKLSKKGGEPIEIAPSINPTIEFVVDDSNVYYFAEDKGGGSFGPVVLTRVAKDGGEPVTLDKGQGGWVKFIAADKTHVYFTDISKVYAFAK